MFQTPHSVAITTVNLSVPINVNTSAAIAAPPCSTSFVFCLLIGVITVRSVRFETVSSVTANKNISDMGFRRVWQSSLRRRWWLLALAVALLAVHSLRLPAEHRATLHFPGVLPQALAHMLADFSYQPNIGSWSVVEDGSNYTTWRYAVSYECGARCAGRAAVEAHDAPRRVAPEHGAAASHHRVAVTLRACRNLPFLPWPTFCDEMDTVAIVSRSGDDNGSSLATVWRSRCSLVDAASGACADSLSAHRDALLLRVRTALSL